MNKKGLESKSGRLLDEMFTGSRHAGCFGFELVKSSACHLTLGKLAEYTVFRYEHFV